MRVEGDVVRDMQDFYLSRDSPFSTFSELARECMREGFHEVKRRVQHGDKGT